MSVFTSIYFDLNKKIDKDNKIPEKNIINTIEKKVDEVFSNMKKRKSNTNFQIDYPWLTI